jgi:hypothetical protein
MPEAEPIPKAGDDYERCDSTAATFFRFAMIRTMLERLTKPGPCQ